MFLIIIEALLYWFVNKGLAINNFKVWEEFHISFLQYVDDTFLIGKTTHAKLLSSKIIFRFCFEYEFSQKLVQSG